MDGTIDGWCRIRVHIPDVTASVVVRMFLPAVEVDTLLGRGVISGVVCACDEHWDRTVGSEDREGMEDDGG